MNDNTMKSKAKAAGVKSGIVLSRETVIMTAFGKGNAAILEKKIDRATIAPLSSPENFGLSLKNAASGNRKERRAGDPEKQAQREAYWKDHPEAKAKYEAAHAAPPATGDAVLAPASTADAYAVLSKRPFAPADALRDNPLKANPRDQLRAKDKLESLLFGETFADTLRVQIAYSVLDVTKIFTPHIANLVYVLNNLARDEKLSADDVIGGLYIDFEDEKKKPSSKCWEQFLTWKKAAQPAFGYFGDAFPERAKDDRRASEAQKQEKEKRYVDAVWCSVALVSALRASVTHGARTNVIFQPERLHPQILAPVSSVYSQRIDKLNADFIKLNATSNLPLLFHYFDAGTDEKQADMTRAYYDFVVRKASKNMGFSLRTVREEMLRLDADGQRLASDDYSTIRHKLYSLLDFIVYRHFTGLTQGQTPDYIISQLRAATDDAQKQRVYASAAKAAWAKLSAPVLAKLVPRIDRIKSEQGADALSAAEKERLAAALAPVRITADNTSPFSQMVYFVSRFLDGKEINDLLTTLIHAFENIQSFRDVERDLVARGELSGVAAFTKGYRLFERSGAIAAELRVVNSFARMSCESPDIKLPQYLDAARVLGIEAIPEGETEADYVSRVLKLGEKSTRESKVDKSFRNFIAKNIVESARFGYLVRYANPQTVKALATPNLLRFVLGRIWENDAARLKEHAGQRGQKSLIARYTEAMGIPADLPKDRQLDELVERLRSISFETFMNVKQKPGKDENEIKEKERLLALARLYLIALYHIVKNLVYVNSRYLIALQRLEADSALHGTGTFGSNGRLADGRHFTDLTRKFADNRWLNAKMCRLLPANMAAGKYDDWLFVVYRNAIAHGGVLARVSEVCETMGRIPSWFALYHYVIQSACLPAALTGYLENWDDKKGKPEDKAALASALGSYSADNGPLEKTLANGNFSKDVLWSLNAPFGYNLARYKNLSMEALFDRNEAPPSDAPESEQSV
jgi:hypothetical protein